MPSLKDLLMTRDQWSAMTHPERVRHYSSVVAKLKIVNAGNVAIYSMFVAGISYLLVGDSLELIRGERAHDPMILGAMAVGLGLSAWKLRSALKAFRAFDGLQAELTKGLIPDALLPTGMSRKS